MASLLEEKSKSIPLKEWIQQAIKSVNAIAINNEAFISTFGGDTSTWPEDIRHSLAITSNSYIFAALKVAYSLANQLCTIQNDEPQDGDSNINISFPTPGDTDWIDQIIVHLSESTNSDDDERDLQPLPLNNNPGIDTTSSELQNNIISTYLNVSRAEFLPCKAKEKSTSCSDDEMKQINSLGLVFYELFSGGEKPSINERRDSSPSLQNTEQSSLDLSNRSLDLSNRLDISDVDREIGDIKSQDTDKDDECLPNKKKGTQDVSKTSSSMETLKLKGLPASICNLIGNMIDNGDVSGEEAYQSMSDVCCDLQLMLDKPNRFLYDLDMDKLAVTGLQLNEYMFGRDEDLSLLQGSYKRSISGQNECGIIVGPSGIGKSVLANRLGSYVSSSGGLFLSGKFDQLRQATPFSALASAFNEYCTKMTNEGRSSHLQEVASKLRIGLGRDARYLVRVIPNLSIILGEEEDTNDQQENDRGVVDAQKRLQYLLCQLVDIIASLSGSPVVLFLDDVQWADAASINVIRQLLMYSESFNTTRQFYLLLSCRPEGMEDKHPFGGMLSGIKLFGINATVVNLAPFDKEMTNTIVSDLLCLSPRITRSLSEIVHQKTKGNPLYFSQLIISLCRDGLLRLSLSRRRWEWDEEKIQSAKLLDDVASFLSSTIKRLPRQVQKALFTLSCFGARSDIELIKTLEKGLECSIIGSLDIAVSESMLNKIGSEYCFGHDWIQETSYNTVPLEERCLLHLQYGLALINPALDHEEDGLLFATANQLNVAGPAAVESKEQGVLISNLNYTAGNKAMEMSDFESAYLFFDHGISFLRKGHWRDHYDLSIKIFDAASKCAMIIHNFVGLKLLSKQIQKFAKTLDDKLNSIYYNVTALAYAKHLPEAIKKSVEVLCQLGEAPPESYTKSEMISHIEKTKSMLNEVSDEELLGYKTMENHSKRMALKFYSRLILMFQMAKPGHASGCVLKMVELSLSEGISPTSPVGFAYFSQLLGGVGQFQEAFRYAKLSHRLLDKMGTREVAGTVIAIESQIRCFVEPVQAAVDLHLQGYDIAMASGDTQGAFHNLISHFVTLFWSGANLQICKNQFGTVLGVLEKHGQLAWRAHIIEIDKWLTVLMGSSQDTGGLSSNPDDYQRVQDILKTNLHASHVVNFQYMYLSFMIREYDKMVIFAEGYFANKHHNWGLLFIQTAHAFYCGLISFWIYRKTSDTLWMERGRQAKIAMKKWAEAASEHNFLHKVYLMEAEEAFSSDDTELAKSMYEKAVATAKKHRFINDEALACELAGYFFLETQQKELALQYFLQAHEKYHEWGAVAKSDAIFSFVQSNLGMQG